MCGEEGSWVKQIDYVKGKTIINEKERLEERKTDGWTCENMSVDDPLLGTLRIL